MASDTASEQPIDLRGLWVPIITPLDDHGEVDTVALAALARRLLADGCVGLVALGTTGEPATLTRSERDQVIDTCAEACAEMGRRLIVGAGSNCTRSTIEEVHHVSQRWNPAALLVVVPYYTRPSEAAVVEHFRAVATSAPVPLVVYNVPYRTGRGLGHDAIAELAGVPGIVGVKQAVGALDHDTLRMLRERPPGFAVLAGDDAYIAPTIMLGGAGAIAAAAHVCTADFSTMVDAALEGDVATASRLSHALLPVVEAGFAEPNPAVWKSVLHATGEINSPTLRPPMSSASTVATTALIEAVRDARRDPVPTLK